MDSVAYQHPGLASGRWAEMPLALQMGNIGSEVSRALKWKTKGKPARSEAAAYRALELMDLSIRSAQNEPRASRRRSRLRELCRDREELCDYFFGDNTFHTDPEALQRYYDQFALMHVNTSGGRHSG